MANIDSKLNTIKSASSGEDVRDAIIGALRDINNDVPADMSNPEDYRGNMASGSDYSDSFNPPKLIRSIYIQQPNTGGKSMRLETIDITRNGKYPTDDPNYNPDEEIRYYKEVNVKVPQLANAIEMETVEITQNGLYDATEWNVDGLRSINVNVNGASGDGPFKVEFYDTPASDPTGAVIETELVPKNGSASCTLLDGTTSGGLYFKGWNPPPSGITRDLKCYPVYGDIIINPGEIQDGWDVICAKKGAEYPLLSTKPLSFAIVVPIETLLAEWIACKSGNPNDTARMRVKTSSTGGVQTICQVSCDMVKVAEGESGSTSTWISTGCIDFSVNGNNSPAQIGFVNDDGSVTWGGSVNIGNQGTHMLICNRSDWLNSGNYTACLDWGGSLIRNFLNNMFLSNLPEPLIRSIVQVNKSYKGWSTLTSTATRIEKTSLDKIWIPSMKEFHTLMEAYTAYTDDTYPSSPLSDVEEINGIDYSVNYVPTWPSAAAPGWWVTRTMVSHINGGTLPMWMCANSSTQYYGSWQRWSGNTNNVPFGFCL